MEIVTIKQRERERESLLRFLHIYLTNTVEILHQTEL